MWGRDQDDVVLVPYTSAMKRLTQFLVLSCLLASSAVAAPTKTPLIMRPATTA